MSIFPFIDSQIMDTSKIDNLPIFKEYLFDFNKMDFVYKNGRVVIVEENDAIIVWVRKALMTNRYRYMAYSWNYGQEFDNLVGSNATTPYLKSEAKRYLEECILINPYVKSVQNVNIEVRREIINISFTLDTIYSEVIMDVDIAR